MLDDSLKQLLEAFICIEWILRYCMVPTYHRRHHLLLLIETCIASMHLGTMLAESVLVDLALELIVQVRDVV